MTGSTRISIQSCNSTLSEGWKKFRGHGVGSFECGPLVSLAFEGRWHNSMEKRTGQEMKRSGLYMNRYFSKEKSRWPAGA